ncbi:MAG: CIC family chloride channel protein [Planctomycetota bacterium]|jgi:CIC family chloride channel protein
MGDVLKKPGSRLRAISNSFDFGSVTKWVFFAAVIGVASGLAAIGFRWLVQMAKEHLFTHVIGTTSEGIGGLDVNIWLILLVPTIGGLVTGILVQKVAPEAEGHGTDAVIQSFHHLQGVVRKRVIAIKSLTSAITIGTGGSAGQEGPVAQVGAGVGSALATFFKLSERDRRMFLLAGASGGIGATFCSPLGGALFMPEVIYKKPEFEGDSIIPCIIASIFAFATFTAISGEHHVIEISSEVVETLNFQPAQLLAYMVLAIACTIVGWLHVKVFYGVHRFFGGLLSVPKFVRPAIGGFLVGVIALVIASFAGEQGIFFGGYGLMTASIEGTLAIPILLGLIVAKIVATALCISSGGSGGVFAPSLAIGALLGAAVGETANSLFPGLGISPAAFALVGMGGFFAGVAKVPVAAVIMVCEMTGHYKLLAPLMLVSVLHVMLSNRWSLYEAQVDGMVDSPAHAGDFVVDVLADIKVSEIMDDARRPHLIHHGTTLGRVLKVVADAKESYFPVTDDNNKLIGIFSLTDLRRIYHEAVVEDMIIARDFMIDSVITAEVKDNLDEVLRRMTQNNINAIPIMDPDNEGEVLAILERNEIGRAYDRRLRDWKSGEVIPNRGKTS